MGKQNINDESIINRWGWIEDYWDKLVVGASEQGGWDRPRPASPHEIRVRLQQLPSPMRDTRVRLLPYFQNIFALIAPTSYMLSLGKNCPNLNFHCPICQSHSMALLPGWQACPTVHMNWSISTHVNQFMYSQSIEEGNSVKNWLVTNLNQISVQCLLPFQSYLEKNAKHLRKFS